MRQRTRLLTDPGYRSDPTSDTASPSASPRPHCRSRQKWPCCCRRKQRRALPPSEAAAMIARLRRGAGATDRRVPRASPVRRRVRRGRALRLRVGLGALHRSVKRDDDRRRALSTAQTHPALAELASTYEEAGCWCALFDTAWRWIYMTKELRLANDGRGALCAFPFGAHAAGAASADTALAWRYGGWTIEGLGKDLGSQAWDRGTVADTPGGREELLAIVDPRLDVVETLSPSTRSMACTFTVPWITGGSSGEDALAYVINGSVMRAAPSSEPLCRWSRNIGNGDYRRDGGKETRGISSG